MKGFSKNIKSKLQSKSLKYYIALTLIFVCCLIALITIGGRVASDGYNYYAYLRSMVIDGDIDFHNDFENYGSAFWRTYKPADTVTGYYTNVFSVGPAILWAPFYLIAHGAVLLVNFFGWSIPANGFSEPYQLSVALASQIYAFIGILMMFRLLRRYYPAGISFISTIAIWLGTFLVYYMIFEPSMSHSLSFFSVTLFLYLWHSSRSTRKTKDWVWLGLSAGLMMLVRWQNGIFMALPASEALIIYLGLLRKQDWPNAFNLLKKHILFLSMVATAFLPQMLVWKIIYGGFLTIPQGTSFMKWTSPFMLETLFSSRHGLFSWHPLFLFGALGWFPLYRRDKLLAGATLVLFLIMTYVNSVVSDWWAGWSFGMRRFDGFLAFLGLGLAAFLTTTKNLVQKNPSSVIAILVALFISGNLLFINQFRGRVVHQGGVVSFQTVYKNMVEQVYKRTGNPFSFPASLLFSLKYKETPHRYDTLVGVYVDDKYFYGHKMDLGKQRFYLGQGWASVNENWQGQFDFISNTSNQPVIYMPLRSKQDYEIVIRMASLTITEDADNQERGFSTISDTLTINLNGSTLKHVELSPNWQEYKVSVPNSLLEKGINVLQLRLNPDTTLGLDFIEFNPAQ